MAESERLDVLEAMREVRDVGMDEWAKATLLVTRSTPYARLSRWLSQPGLIAAAILRKTREKSMSRLLGSLNMPSRSDVLSLSQRLTHIESAIDDLGAAMEAVRAAAAPQGRRAPPRETHADGGRQRWRPGDR